MSTIHTSMRSLLALGVLAGHTFALTDALYWTDSSNTPSGIYRKTLGGGAIEPVVIAGGTSDLRGLTLDRVRGRMYWFEAGPRRVRSAATDGSDVKVIVEDVGELCYGVAIDSLGGRIYWCHGDLDGPDDSLRCAALDGSNQQIIVSTGLTKPVGIAVDPVRSLLFWSDLGDRMIRRCRPDGSEMQIVVANTEGEVYALAVDEGAGWLYWSVISSQSAPGSIRRSRFDGSQPEVVFSGLCSPTSIVPSTHEGKIWWTESEVFAAPGIVQGNLFDGSTSSFVVDHGVPWGLALFDGVGCSPSDDTVAWYRFENGPANGPGSGIVPSSVPGASPGVVEGAALYRSTPPHPTVPQSGASNALCLELDGIDDVVRFDDAFVFNAQNGDATLEFWIRAPDQHHAALFWGRNDIVDGNRFQLTLNDGGMMHFDYREPGSWGAPLHTLLESDGTFLLPIETWTHVAITRRVHPGGHEYRFYREGALMHVANDPAPRLPDSSSWTLSGRPAPHNHAEGLIDEIRTSRRALDPSEFLVTPFMDINGNGIADACECEIAPECPTTPNSAGAGAFMQVLGSSSIAQNNFILTTSGCPPNVRAVYLTSASAHSAPFGNGTLCLGSPIQRVGSTVTSTSGIAARVVSLTSPLGGEFVQPGTIRRFQCWFRDLAAGGAGTDLSDSIRVRFCP